MTIQPSVDRANYTRLCQRRVKYHRFICELPLTKEGIMPVLPEPTIGDTEWFVHDRFGMFIHWGIYALPARHEWVKNFERTTNEEYQKYFDHFNPDLFDPREWARAAREAGMKYLVITSK